MRISVTILALCRLRNTRFLISAETRAASIRTWARRPKANAAISRSWGSEASSILIRGWTAPPLGSYVCKFMCLTRKPKNVSYLTSFDMCILTCKICYSICCSTHHAICNSMDRAPALKWMTFLLRRQFWLRLPLLTAVDPSDWSRFKFNPRSTGCAFTIIALSFYKPLNYSLSESFPMEWRKVITSSVSYTGDLRNQTCGWSSGAIGTYVPVSHNGTQTKRRSRMGRHPQEHRLANVVHEWDDAGNRLSLKNWKDTTKPQNQVGRRTSSDRLRQWHLTIRALPRGHDNLLRIERQTGWECGCSSQFGTEGN